jgi:hypothetical protein
MGASVSAARANTAKARGGQENRARDSAGVRFTSVALTLFADSKVPEVLDAGIVQVVEFLAQVFLALLLVR